MQPCSETWHAHGGKGGLRRALHCNAGSADRPRGKCTLQRRHAAAQATTLASRLLLGKPFWSKQAQSMPSPMPSPHAGLFVALPATKAHDVSTTDLMPAYHILSLPLALGSNSQVKPCSASPSASRGWASTASITERTASGCTWREGSRGGGGGVSLAGRRAA